MGWAVHCFRAKNSLNLLISTCVRVCVFVRVQSSTPLTGGFQNWSPESALWLNDCQTLTGSEGLALLCVHSTPCW